MNRLFPLMVTVAAAPLLSAGLPPALDGPIASATQSVAPLYVFANGNGTVRVSPAPRSYASGDALPVGQRFVLTAVPGRDNRFVNWSPVSVFVTQEPFTNADGSVSIIKSVLPMPEPGTFSGIKLQGRVQPWQSVVDTPVMEISTGPGWQANFAPQKTR